MSRSAARGKRSRGKVARKGLVSREDFRRAMQGILFIAEDRDAVLEEAPQAYKDIDLVIEAVTGARLASVVARMRPMAVLKG